MYLQALAMYRDAHDHVSMYLWPCFHLSMIMCTHMHMHMHMALDTCVEIEEALLAGTQCIVMHYGQLCSLAKRCRPEWRICEFIMGYRVNH
jgi:hypothetical protein